MKLRTLAVCAGLGIVGSSAGAMAIPLRSEAKDALTELRPEPKTARDNAHFTAGQTLLVDGRLGHANLAKTGQAETYFFASVKGSDPPGQTAPPLNLAIVIDRSGSMKGDRISNAVAAAVAMVERMRDGDSVSVVSFDTQSTIVVPPTLASSSTRDSIEAAIRSIRLGGDTCISCGLEEGMRMLDRTALGADRVSRMILLSDGATNAGVRDLGGLRGMAGRMRDKGVSISTIGVDVSFDEKVMAAIAVESNGQHYFVANPTGLPAIFAQEFDSLLGSIAGDSELTVELPPGVEVVQVFDRTFRREGSRIVVPFGTFSAKQEKTVLMQLRVPADKEGVQPVVDVKLAYRDFLTKADGSCSGSLAVNVTTDKAAVFDLDPFVAARIERSRTAQTLTEANRLFALGKVDEARDTLKRQEASLAKTEASARNTVPRPAPANHSLSFDKDIANQRRVVLNAEKNLAPEPSKPKKKPMDKMDKSDPWASDGVKTNQAEAADLLK
jgi:Ca-activated chloride channel family protein